MHITLSSSTLAAFMCSNRNLDASKFFWTCRKKFRQKIWTCRNFFSTCPKKFGRSKCHMNTTIAWQAQLIETQGSSFWKWQEETFYDPCREKSVSCTTGCTFLYLVCDNVETLKVPEIVWVHFILMGIGSKFKTMTLDAWASLWDDWCNETQEQST